MAGAAAAPPARPPAGRRGAPGAVASINTLDLKLDEPAVNALARRLARPVRAFTAAELLQKWSPVDILALKI